MRTFAPFLALLLIVPAMVAAHPAWTLRPPPGVPPVDAPPHAQPQAFPRCEHPWPCADGSEWPRELVGPFAIRDPEPLRIPVADDVELEAYVWHPVLPEGVRAPVVMHAQPYAGQCYLGVSCMPRGDDAYWLDEFALRPIVEAGHAVVNVNVRGTGTSGGCFDFNGPREARDLAEAVEWLATQPWSNGRVGMTGLSYMGTTPFITANLNPPSLKTIVPEGIATHEYTFWFTPQGAPYLPSAATHMLYVTGVGAYPPLGAPQNLAAWPSVAGERACPELLAMMQAGVGERTGEQRSETYFGERAHVMQFPDITASALIVHGFADLGGHRFAEDAVWGTLERAPKRMLLGDWSHVVPVDELTGYPGGEDWGEVIGDWLDFWLKGVGEPPRLGVVDYQDRQGTWRASTSWPPAEAPVGARREEVHYLSGGALAASPSAAAPAGFRSVTAGGDEAGTAFCGAPSAIAKFEGPVLADRVVIAGNPHAYLHVESDGPAGLLAIDLYDIGPDATCVGGILLGGEWLSGGAADLRFHEGNLAARAFPVGEPRHVRIDMANLAAAVEPGHRLVAVASGYGHVGKVSTPAYPHLQLHAGAGATASHLVIPLVEGSLGGQPPTLEYPPRPFVP